MDLKHHFIKDAGCLAATCVTLGTAVTAVPAVAAVTPKPHNFNPPKTHVQHMHTDPHNFVRAPQL